MSNNFELFYRSIGPYYSDFYTELINWCQINDATLGISGSTICKELFKGSDFDFIIIAPNSLFDDCQNIQLPLSIDSTGWVTFKHLYNSNKIEVYGTHSIKNEINRIEIYPISIVKRILNLEEFEIRRFKKTPKKTKKELFFNMNGDKITRNIEPIDLPDGIYSVTKSYVLYENNIYWGMHAERLALGLPLIEKDAFWSRSKIKFVKYLHEHTNKNEKLLKTCIKNSFFVTKNSLFNIDCIYEEFNRIISQK